MIPKEIHEQKYISVATFRKNGVPVYTPVWFAEWNEKLYVKTRNDSGKYKRIRNNPAVRVAPCTARGKIAGPEFAGKARILLPEQAKGPSEAIGHKYWLARLPFWSKQNEYLEIEIEQDANKSA
jgi:PPOX class probable F420-dependent enzyme